MSRRVAEQHGDWLRLVDVSGPFLSLSAVQQAFPHGLEPEEQGSARLFSQALDELRTRDADVSAYSAFIDLVVRDILGYSGAHDQRGASIADLFAPQADGGAVRPTALLGERENPARTILLVVAPRGESLVSLTDDDGGRSSWEERSRLLARATGIPCVLLTNGDVWTIVYAGDPDRPTTYARFIADVLSEDRVLFRAFSSLLSCDRLLGAGDAETLGALLASSKDEEIELTKQLGAQALRAVEMIVFALDLHDANHEGALSKYIEMLYPTRRSEEVLYEGAVVTLMRLMFLLAAEDRGLLPDDEPWLESYAIGGLLLELRKEDEAVLERRYDAWGRLGATFRAIFFGVEHDAVRLPGYGGDLFDPAKYGFLERDATGAPVNVSNGLVLRILREIQEAEVRSFGQIERRALSYRALSVEQLGFVYEGLLDHTARRANGVVLGLDGPREPELEVELLEEKASVGRQELIDFLKNSTGRSRSALEQALGRPPSAGTVLRAEHLLVDDAEALERVRPWLSLVPQEEVSRPWLVRPGRAYVTLSEGRSQSSSFYTPRVLTDSIVKKALDPLCYEGVRDGLSEQEWELRQASDLLELRVCDIAMGSGAFLVAVVRYLGSLVAQAWASQSSEFMVSDAVDYEARFQLAKRQVVEKCVYGVDRNPLAVEMAKLSLWLETLQKDRPFTFVDHALRVGDSLVGLTSVNELRHLALGQDGQLDVMGDAGRAAVERELKALAEGRQELMRTDANDLLSVEAKKVLLASIENRVLGLRSVADLVVALTMAHGGVSDQARADIGAWSATIVAILHAGEDSTAISNEAARLLRTQAAPGDGLVPRPFHWVLEFPEVFSSRAGFDAIVGNPPYLGGRKLSGTLGADYRSLLMRVVADGARGSADLAGYFVIRAARLASADGTMGLVTTNSVGQGLTREVGLEKLCGEGWNIFDAVPNHHWPGDAAVVVSTFWMSREMPASFDTRFGRPARVAGQPQTLANGERAFQGTILTGSGFLLDEAEYRFFQEHHRDECEVIQPFVNADDVTTLVPPTHSRWVINFGERTLEEASRYTAAFSRVESLVRRERANNRREIVAREWWRFQERRPSLYATVAGQDRVLVGPGTAKWWFVVWLPPAWVYSGALNVFAANDDGRAAVFSSSWHEAWARRWSGSLNDRLRYSPTQCLRNFPMPADDRPLREIGDSYLATRNKAQLELECGLTDLYNRVHEDPADTSDPVMQMRELRKRLDQAVLNAYGWEDIAVDHEHRAVPLVGEPVQRFVVSDALQQEVQDRLLELNFALSRKEKAPLAQHGRRRGDLPAIEGQSAMDLG